LSPAAPSTYPAARACLVLALILPVFAIAPLFYPGYIQTHSGFVPIWNVVDLRANGPWNWTPQIAVNFDPLRSDGLLPYYLVNLLPLEPVTAIKVVLGLGWLLGSAGMFFWLRHWLSHPGALVAALAYTYLPYHIATVYVRGAWGEALFWGLLPWAIFFSQQYHEVNNSSSNTEHAAEGTPPGVRKRATPSTSYLLRIALILFIWLLLGLSQLGLTIWALVFVTLLLLILNTRQSLWPIIASILGTFLAAVVSFLLSARFSSPLAPSSPHFSDHFLYPFQLLSAFWGFGPSRAGWDDGLSLQLGLAAIGLTILSMTLWQRNGSGELSISRTDRRLVFFITAALVCVLLQFGFSHLLWRVPLLPSFTLADTLTYPWQLLGLAGLCLAVLAGCALWLDDQLTRLPLFGAIIILVILSSYSYLEPQFIQMDLDVMDGPEAQLGSTQLALLAHSFSTITNGNTAGVESGPTRISLAAHGPLHANEMLEVNVTWQPLQPFAEDWKVFVHLVDADGKILAQFDGQPLAGDYPTSHWIPGELIKDTYPLGFPAAASPGPYRVFLGLYNEATGERLPVLGDVEGKVVLDVE
jgi:hypothetical protein